MRLILCAAVLLACMFEANAQRRPVIRGNVTVNNFNRPGGNNVAFVRGNVSHVGTQSFAFSRGYGSSFYGRSAFTFSPFYSQTLVIAAPLYNQPLILAQPLTYTVPAYTASVAEQSVATRERIIIIER